MNEYISREELLEKEKHQEDWNMFLDYVTIDDVKSIPAADVRENIHAKWEDMADPIDSRWGRKYYQCPKCSKRADYFMGGSEDWWCVDKPNFCPSCGAIMDAEPKVTAKVEIAGEPIHKTIAEIPKEPKISLCDTCSRTECTTRAFGNMICTICAMRKPIEEKGE